MDDGPWEESLGLDDSDLPPLRHQNHRTSTTTTETATVVSLPQPFLRPCSLLSLPSQNRQTLSSPNPPPRLIPGPAGVVQTAMKRRKHQIEDPIPTQEYIKRAVEDGVGDEDDDFSHDPWLASVDFIRRQGLVIDSDGAIGFPLSAIKSGVVNLDDKVAQVVAIVKSCKPNGLGDLMVTLKDPTASIDASVHRGVVSSNEFGKDISVGAVMILKNVAIFAPSRHVHYLNITVRNVVKVISKDGGGLSTQSGCSATLKSKEGGDRGNEVILKSLGYEANGRDIESVGGDNGALLTQSGCSATLKSKEGGDRGNEVIMKSLGYGREIESVGGDSGGLLTQSGCSAKVKSKGGVDIGNEVIMKGLGYGREIESVGGDSGGLLAQSGCSAKLKGKEGGDRGNEVIMKSLGYGREIESVGGDSGGLLTQSGCSATLKSKDGGDKGNEVIMKSFGFESNGRDIEIVGGDSGALLTHSGCSATLKSKEVGDKGNEVIMKSLGYGREIESVGGDSGGLLTQSGCSATLKSKDGGDRGAEVLIKSSATMEKERVKDGDLVDMHTCKEIGNGDGAKDSVQQSSKASVLQWTDEQLEELFASD